MFVIFFDYFPGLFFLFTFSFIFLYQVECDHATLQKVFKFVFSEMNTQKRETTQKVRTVLNAFLFGTSSNRKHQQPYNITKVEREVKKGWEGKKKKMGYLFFNFQFGHAALEKLNKVTKEDLFESLDVESGVEVFDEMLPTDLCKVVVFLLSQTPSPKKITFNFFFFSKAFVDCGEKYLHLAKEMEGGKILEINTDLTKKAPKFLELQKKAEDILGDSLPPETRSTWCFMKMDPKVVRIIFFYNHFFFLFFLKLIFFLKKKKNTVHFDAPPNKKCRSNIFYLNRCFGE